MGQRYMNYRSMGTRSLDFNKRNSIVDENKRKRFTLIFP
jgi:hypothetical protein